MDELKSLLAKVAPWLAAAATGPAGLAAQAIKTAAEALGASSASVSNVTAALTGATAEQLGALKAAEQGFQERMQSLGFAHVESIERIAAADRASARGNNLAGGLSNKVFWLSIIIIIAVIGIEAVVLFNGVPKSVDGQMAGRVLGTMDMILAAVVYYIYGSSAGSARKDEANLAKGGAA